MSRTKQFKDMIQSRDLQFLMEAHSGLSAKIVEEAGFKGIRANHNLRASIDAVQQIPSKIYQDQSLIQIEGSVPSVDEIFRLQRGAELQEAEKISSYHGIGIR